MQIGPEAVALVVVLHKGFGLPLAHVVTLLRDRFGIRVTRGALVQVCARMATRATPTYEALCAQVRGSPVVSPNETGWKVAGTLHWLWAFATADTTVYAIRPGRGFVDAATILGKDFAGVLARHGLAPYRRFGRADHQTCVAHLLRRCRLLQLDHPRGPFAARVQQRLQQALALRDRYAAGDVSAHGPRQRARPAAQADARPAHHHAVDDPSRTAIRRPSDGRSVGPLHLPRGPRDRRDQLARRTRDSPRGRHAQGLRRQPQRPGSADPTGPHVRAPHHASTGARSRRAPRHDLAGADPQRAALAASPAAVAPPVKQRRHGKDLCVLGWRWLGLSWSIRGRLVSEPDVSGLAHPERLHLFSQPLRRRVEVLPNRFRHCSVVGHTVS